MNALLVDFLLIPCLLLMFLQDLKQRALYVIWFPVCFVFFAWRLVLIEGLDVLIMSILGNSVILIVSIISFLIVSKIFGLIRGRSLVIGLGDLLFYLSMMSYCGSIEYIITITISSIVILIAYAPFTLRNHAFKIPLAGSQSLLLAILISMEYMGVSFPIKHVFIKTLLL